MSSNELEEFLDDHCIAMNAKCENGRVVVKLQHRFMLTVRHARLEAIADGKDVIDAASNAMQKWKRAEA